MKNMCCIHCTSDMLVSGIEKCHCMNSIIVITQFIDDDRRVYEQLKEHKVLAGITVLCVNG